MRQRAEDLAHPRDVGQRIAPPAPGVLVLVGGWQPAVALGVADRLFRAADHLGGGADIEAQIQLLLRARREDALAQPVDHGGGAAAEDGKLVKRDGWKSTVHDAGPLFAGTMHFRGLAVKFAHGGFMAQKPEDDGRDTRERFSEASGLLNRTCKRISRPDL